MIRSSLVIAIVACLVNRTKGIHEEHVFHAPLDQKNTMSLNWQVFYESENVVFEIHLPSDFGWFAVGFSDRGDKFPADYCVLWRSWKGDVHFQDVFSDEKGVLQLDKQQDCNEFKIKRYEAVTKFTYRRKFDTCDEDDYVIEDGTTHIVWARGRGPLYRASGLNISVSDSSMIRVQLLKNLNGSPTLAEPTETLDILTDRVQVPAEETTYWCHVHKLPEKFDRKHHVFRYESNVDARNEGVVHHMEVFHCITAGDEEIPLYVGSCFAQNRPDATRVCKRVLAAWAMGATAFTYPEQAGLPIGGDKFSKYIMLEVHYNNPMKEKGIVDSSGVRFHLSSKLRRFDAGIIELGLEYTDKMAIPPGQRSFVLTGFCVGECTAVSLPPDGITIFGSQLHTHLTGTKVWTRHVRDGRELPELNRDNHYSTHFQEIRKLKTLVRILPGDALITNCEYRSEGRQNVTLGGFAISDEMCVNYVHYYPATTLEVCKSAISDQALTTYFEYMRSWENQGTSKSAPISKNYGNVRWNPMRVQLLRDVYDEAPLSMQCNMSSGDRFPGYWENTPSTGIYLPLPPPNRQCKTSVYN